MQLIINHEFTMKSEDHWTSKMAIDFQDGDGHPKWRGISKM